MSHHTGNLFIVAAPSGGGKTSLIREVVKTLPNTGISISHTTRPIRHGEIDKKDYFFISEDQFISMIDEGAFIEHAKVFDYYYGTSLQQIDNRLKSGMDIFLDIDWQGALQIRRLYQDAISIFVLPPSLDVLRQRLCDRKRDNDDIIEKRMAEAQSEMSHYPEFDYLIFNNDFNQAVDELKAIVMSNRLKISRQTQKYPEILSLLLGSQ